VSADAYLPYVSRLPLSWPDAGEAAVPRWVEGALLFVDVAGFTALSERLGRTGRAGAEELTELLDGAFARLLSAAYEDGGSLLSFGGDALLLFFEGADHARRAGHAAAVVSRKPAEIGPLRSSVGQVRLRLSMGAHSGRFLFLVSGVDSRVVLLLGPDTTATVRLEQRASGGQVLVGPSLAAAVPEAVGPVEDGVALLKRVPRPPLQGNPSPPEPVTPAARFLSPPVREHIAQRPSSEHRPVAVGFLQLRGTDALLAEDEAAAVDAVDRLVRRTQEAAADYGVTLLATDVDADGAKLILVAGAPVAGEHSEERLLRACRAVLDLPTPLQVRAGVTSGHVFVGDVGPPYRRTFTVLGERVNLAARLMASASPGELRTTPSVLARCASAFRTTALEPLRLKGIAQPVDAVAVGAPVGQQAATHQGGLLGREAELAALRASLEAARGGDGSCLELVGEAGTGKTALLAALVAQEDVPALRAAAVPYEAETAFGLVRRVLRRVLGIDTDAPAAEVGRHLVGALPRASAQDLGLLAMAADGELPPEAEAGTAVVQDELLVPRLARAVRRALEGLVTGPAVLVVEDLQWADPSSLALLRAVADHLDEHPWLLCASHRPASAAPTALLGGTVLPVGPLAEEDATELVHALTADAPLSPHRVAAIVQRSGGNALFLTELVRLQRDSTDLPDTVEAVVHARLDALPGYLLRTVRQAAVLGAACDLELLAAVAGFVPDRAEWKQLEGVLRRTGSRAVFSGEVYRDVAYDSLPFRERRRLHGLALEQLLRQGSTDVELLALHAAQAQDDGRTWRWSVEAARRAMARGAHEQAVVALRRALLAHERGKLGAPEERSPVLALLGDALVRAGRAEESLVVYRRARATSPLGTHGDPVLCHKEALARIALGDHAGARRWLRRGLTAAADDLPARLELLESQAGVMYRQGLYRGALRTLEELLVLTEGTEHRRSNAHAHDLTHLVMTTTGDPRRAEHRDQAVAIYHELGDLRGLAKALNNLGLDALHECRWNDAVALYEQARELDERDADDVGAAIGDSNIAEVLLDQGGWDEAHRRLVRALRTFRAEGFRLGVAEVLDHLGRLETRRGRPEEARAHLAEAHGLVTAMDAESLLPDVLVREAELAVTVGALDEAERLLDAVEQAAELREELRLTVQHQRALVLAGRAELEDAVALLRRVVAAEAGDHQFRVALARHSLCVLLARLGSPEATTHRFAALESMRRLGVHRFRDPLVGAEPVVVTAPPGVLDLSARREERAAV